MTQSTVYTPTPSQEAAVAMHLDRRAEWRTVRLNGTRYVVLPSGRSDRVYHVRADARGCDCRWSLTMRTPCSHRVAVERQAMLEELAEAPAPTFASLRAEFPGCAAACGQITEGGNLFCDNCSAAREREQRQAAQRSLPTHGPRSLTDLDAQAALDAIQAGINAARRQPTYEDIFGVCDASGCGEDRQSGERYCRRHVLVDAF